MAGLDGSTLRSEIGEQPAVLAITLDQLAGSTESAGRAIRTRRPALALMVGRGSSANVGQYGRYLLEVTASIPVSIAAPSVVTMYASRPAWGNAATIAVSQSGSGPDVLEVVAAAGRSGALTVAVTNNAKSALATASEHVLVTPAGKEVSIPATKTFTSAMLAMAMLAGRVADAPQAFGLAPADLAQVPAAAAHVLKSEHRIAAVAAGLADITRCVVLGRGMNRAAAAEVALKITEAAYVLAEDQGAADFLHGPVAVIDRGFVVIALVAGGPTQAAVLESVRRARARGARTIVITDGVQRPSARRFADELLELDSGLPEALRPIGLSIAGQLLALHMALGRGIDPERPRSLNKITATR